MTQVDEQRLKGNSAAAWVAQALSEWCLVRPVADGTDVGVDFYCEYVERDGDVLRPHLHFWVQVKGGQSQVRGKGGRLGCYFSGRHLDYWERQPVPVFAALVRTGWPRRGKPPIHMVNITEWLIDHPKKLPTQRRRGLTIWSSHVIRAGKSANDARVFLEKGVLRSVALRGYPLGIITNLPEVTPRYVHEVPKGPKADYSRRMLSRMRFTVGHAIWAWVEEDALREHDVERRLLAQVLELVVPYLERRHKQWETYGALGANAHADGDFAGAVNRYEQALAVIAADTKAKPGAFGGHRNQLLKLIARAKSGKSCRLR